MTAERQLFGRLPDGREVHRFVLRGNGIDAAVLTYGAALQSVRVPDARGDVSEVTLGYDDLGGYLGGTSYLGAVVGRYANRIANGHFTLDGVEYSLPRNHGSSCLHGGPEGFDTQLWSARELPDGVELSLTSPDGDMGFPGTMRATVAYTVQPGQLTLEYSATTDRPTVVNLSNHTYWNLDGAGSIERHRLQLQASRFAVVDAGLVPTGELRPVEGTPMDFRTPRAIAAELRSSDEQLQHARGYDHAWVLDDGDGVRPAARLVARLVAAHSGRVLDVLTDQPSVQFYSGNFLDGSDVGRGGRAYRQGDGLCLETQHLPDSPNHPEFPSTVLRPGDRYSTTTVFRFASLPEAA